MNTQFIIERLNAEPFRKGLSLVRVLALTYACTQCRMSVCGARGGLLRAALVVRVLQHLPFLRRGCRVDVCVCRCRRRSLPLPHRFS